MNCSQCGSYVEPGNRFCANCGAKVEESTGWSCICGNTNIQTKFCSRCGRSQDDQENQTSAFNPNATLSDEDYDKTVVISKPVDIPITPQKSVTTGVLFSSRCEECGEMLTADMKVCPKCGNKVKDDDSDEIIESETTVLVSSDPLFTPTQDLDSTVVADQDSSSGFFADPDATVMVDSNPTMNNNAYTTSQNTVNTDSSNGQSSLAAPEPFVSPSNQVTCPSCGMVQEAGFKFCQRCGNLMENKQVNLAPKSYGFCMKCGTPLNENGTCPKCDVQPRPTFPNMGAQIGGNALVRVCNNPVTIAFLGLTALSVLISLITLLMNINFSGLLSLIVPTLLCLSGWLAWYNAKQNKNSETPYTIINACMILGMVGSVFIGLLGVIIFASFAKYDSMVGYGLIFMLVFIAFGVVLFRLYSGFKKTNEQVKNYAIGRATSIGPVSVPVFIYIMIGLLAFSFVFLMIARSAMSDYIYNLQWAAYMYNVSIDFSGLITKLEISTFIQIIEYICLVTLLKELGKQ